MISAESGWPSRTHPLVMDELRRTFPSGKRVEFYLAHPLEMEYCLRQKFDPFLASHYR